MGRPPRVGQAPGRRRSSSPARPRSTRRRASPSASIRPTLADPGATRVRQDLHRRPDDRGAPARRASGSGSPRRATRSSATSCGPSLEAAGPGRRPCGPARPQGPGRRGPGRDPRARTPADPRTRLDDGRANLAAGTSWLWASSKMQDAIDVLFVDEAGQISLANVVSMTRATDSLVLLGDPQQLDQPHARLAPTRAPIDRPWRTSSMTTRPCHRTGDSSSSTRGACIRRSATSRPRSSTTSRLESRPELAAQRLESEVVLLDGVGPRVIEVAAVGADSESPLEAERGRGRRSIPGRRRHARGPTAEASAGRSAGTTS